MVSYIYSAIALLNVSCYMCLHVLKPALLQNNAAPAVFTSLAAATAACSMPCPSPGRLPRLWQSQQQPPQMAQTGIEGLKDMHWNCKLHWVHIFKYISGCILYIYIYIYMRAPSLLLSHAFVSMKWKFQLSLAFCICLPFPVSCFHFLRGMSCEEKKMLKINICKGNNTIILKERK